MQSARLRIVLKCGKYLMFAWGPHAWSRDALFEPVSLPSKFQKLAHVPGVKSVNYFEGP